MGINMAFLVTFRERRCMPPLPHRYLRNDACYRSLAVSRRGQNQYEDFGCGFIHRGRGNRDILFRCYGALYILQGSGIYIDWNGREYPLYPGCVAQRLPGKLHTTLYDNEDEWCECWVTMTTSLYLPLAAMGIIDEEKPVLHPGLDFSYIQRFEDLLEDMKRVPDEDIPQLLPRMLGIITTFHAMDRNNTAGRDQRIAQQAQEMLARDLAQPADIQALARTFHVSYERFRKIFAAETGCAPHQYRIRKKMETAAVLLSRDRLPVKEVAARLGYPDEFSFARQFRRLVGVAPGRFRDHR